MKDYDFVTSDLRRLIELLSDLEKNGGELAASVFVTVSPDGIIIE